MRLAVLLVASFALVVTASAAGVGPSLPDVNGAVSIAEVSYVTAAHGATTTLSQAGRGQGRRPARRCRGRGGPDGHAPRHEWRAEPRRPHARPRQQRPPGRALRARSSFAVVSTRDLQLSARSPFAATTASTLFRRSGRWLYLIHHMQSAPGLRYQVKAYDLRAGKLLPA